MKVNGCPIELLEPEILRVKVFEPLLLLGPERFAGVDMRIRVRGGGYTSQIYAIRQAIAKGIVAYYQKCKCWCRSWGVLLTSWVRGRVECENARRVGRSSARRQSSGRWKRVQQARLHALGMVWCRRVSALCRCFDSTQGRGQLRSAVSCRMLAATLEMAGPDLLSTTCGSAPGPHLGGVGAICLYRGIF